MTKIPTQMSFQEDQILGQRVDLTASVERLPILSAMGLSMGNCFQQSGELPKEYEYTNSPTFEGLGALSAAQNSCRYTTIENPAQKENSKPLFYDMLVAEEVQELKNFEELPAPKDQEINRIVSFGGEPDDS